MSEQTSYEISPEGIAQIEAVDGYLDETIREGRPIEALIATKRLGEIASERTKEAARAATDSSWSWADVGQALGMSKQAAHEKLRARVHGEIEKGLSKLDRADKSAHEKITRKAMRKRERLGQVPSSPEVDLARQQIDEWEQRQYDKLARGIGTARGGLERAERTVNDKLDRS
ncbi:MAG: hypothetical protein QOG16_414 [Actinomycetota bacterium]|jgi:hypothetical protein|nr:hypothetical protein [Actinomycetota bacterium]